MNHMPKIGAFVLETLTTGMYINPFDAIREYIQNASDSIFNAERMSFIQKNKGKITLEIDPVLRNLIIRDNGTGISSTEVTSRLLDVGMSKKLYGQEAGFRGIGRLAGIAYCKELKFVTSYRYEEERSIITFDCEGIRRSISPAMREVEELADILKKYTTQDLHSDSKEKHFLEVHMLGIDPTVSQFMDHSAIEDYLCQVAPVEYDAQRFVFATKIQKWAADNNIEIPYVNLVIKTHDGERQVFKPYKTTYSTKKGDYKIDVQDISCLKSINPEGKTFWMWYSKTDLLGMFNDEKVAGLRFRRNNISIGGPNRVEELFPGKEGRLNYWMIGEIHILSDQIIPNARRDGFEATPAWDSLKNELDPFIKKHCKNCHDASNASNRPTAKVLSSASETIKSVKKSLKAGLVSNTEREDLLRKIDKEEQRVQSSLIKRKDVNERQQIQSVLTSLHDIRKNLEEHTGFTLDKIKSNLDRKQRKVLIDVLEIIDAAFREIGCKQAPGCLESIKIKVLSKYGIN